MKQLTQKLKSGTITIEEVPVPSLNAGMVLVRNHYSLISAGTEGSTVKAARKSLVGKVKERPEQARQVLEVLKSQGPVQTYRAVMKKLDAYSPLGYSCAGEVIEVGAGVNEFSVGDRVACAGYHAEVVCVPANLCVKLAADADLKKACYNTLGAIALQGIRQADLRLGESCAVIGLGLLGQLTCLMLQAGGITAYGIDLDPLVVAAAREHCTVRAWARSENGIADQIETLSGGLGVDAVIITAAGASLDPVNFAGQITRKKGRVVVVGAVPTGFDRDPYYYKKELELRMSCSYGPGRYDLNYEEKGMDYPAAYVRWTENRNMMAFQEMVHSGRIDLDYLTTHEFALDEAAKAYEMIVSRSQAFLGIVLKYDVDSPMKRIRIEVNERKPAAKVGIAFIGAGSYAQGNLLPHVPKNDSNIQCKAVLTNSGTTSKRVAERYGFEFCTSDVADILDNKDVNTVFVATRHDSHADYVLKSLQAGKYVFVEKPLCLKAEELTEIEEALSSQNGHLMVGFNRRFAPHTVTLKHRLAEAPMSVIYRVNAGTIPSESWIQDPAIGGGRIIGEVCHFVDFLTYICKSLPVRVFASALPDPKHLDDTVTINLEFANGSVGTICYFANGSKKLTKEYVEVYQSGLTGIIRDFKELEIYTGSSRERKKLLSQDKGQASMVKAFVNCIRDGGAPLIKTEELLSVGKATFAVLESLRTHQAVSVQI